MLNIDLRLLSLRSSYNHSPAFSEFRSGLRHHSKLTKTILTLLLFCHLMSSGVAFKMFTTSNQIEDLQNRPLKPLNFLEPKNVAYSKENNANILSVRTLGAESSLQSHDLNNNVTVSNIASVHESNNGPERLLTSAAGQDAQINIYTNNDQNIQEMAVLKDGSFVVVWQSNGQDGSGTGVYARIFSTNADSFNSEFLVNTNVANDEDSPSVAGLEDGGFIVAWRKGSDTDNHEDDVFAQRFYANGTKFGPEFQVNVFAADAQNAPNVASLIDGGYIIAWQSWLQDTDDWGCFATLYNLDGSVRRSEFQINTYITSGQTGPIAAPLLNGGFVVVWNSFFQDGSFYGIYAQIFNSDGSESGSEFGVNNYTADSQDNPRVAGLANGGFVVCWNSEGQDGDDYGAYAQMFDSNGAKIGLEFRVNNYVIGAQENPYPASLGSDGFFIVFDSANETASGSGADIFIQKYDLNGNPLYSNEALVNTYITGDQHVPSIAVSSGSYLILWTSEGGQDGSGAGVFGKLYDKSDTPVPIGDSTCSLYSGACTISTAKAYDTTTQATYMKSSQAVYSLGAQAVYNTSTQAIYDLSTQAVYNPATQRVVPINYSPVLAYLSEKGLDISFTAVSAIQNNPNTVQSLGNGLERTLFDLIVLSVSFGLTGVFMLFQRKHLDSKGRLYNKHTGIFTNSLKVYAAELAELASIYWFARPIYILLANKHTVLTLDYRSLCDQYSQSALFVLFFFLFKHCKLRHLRRVMETHFTSQRGTLKNCRVLLQDAIIVIFVTSIQILLPTQSLDNTFVGKCIGNTVYYVFVYLWADQSLNWMREKLFVDLLPMFSSGGLIHYVRRCSFYNKAEMYLLTTQQLCNQIMADAKHKFDTIELVLILNPAGTSDSQYLLVSRGINTRGVRGTPIAFRTEVYEDRSQIDHLIASEKGKDKNKDTDKDLNSSANAGSLCSTETKALRQTHSRKLKHRRVAHDMCFFVPAHDVSNKTAENDIMLVDMVSGQRLKWQLDTASAGSLAYNSEKRSLLLINAVPSSSSNHITVRVYDLKNKHKHRIENDVFTQSAQFTPGDINSPESVLDLKERVWNEAQMIERQIRHIKQEKKMIKLDECISVDIDRNFYQRHYKRHIWSPLTDCFQNMIRRLRQPSRKKVHVKNLAMGRENIIDSESVREDVLIHGKRSLE